MTRKILIFSLFILASGFSFAQNKLWTITSDEKLGDLEKMERASTPFSYQIMNLNFEAFKRSLVGAPLDTDNVFSNVVVDFPNSKGELSKFRIYEAPIMEKGLADRYPDIKSYSAIGIDNPAVKLRFSVTIFGLHVMSLSGDEGTYYIDTYTKDLNNYIVYNKKNLQSVRTFGCKVEEDPEAIVAQNRSQFTNEPLASDSRFRQYRLAMACTVEYASFHVNAAGVSTGTTEAKKAAVLAAMNVTMTRVNGIYERDLSLRMNFVSNNDLIIFIDTDSFDNLNANNNLLAQSQTVITNTIGSANFDIGHTVSTGGGGVAGLGVVCDSFQKARGITGSPSPVGDAYDVDFVAHEMGHQFGAPHTFSSNDDTAGNCDLDNVSNSTAVEPGSGSTIMAYAGICEENVQSNSDAYFHASSLQSIANFIASTSCASSILNNNNPPVISPLSSYIIPKGTAFVLTGTATDSNPNALTYCWEQVDAVPGTNYPTTIQTSGPVYRSLSPSTSNKRYFPNFQSVLQGNLTPTWEVTPDVTRQLNFALTVRDNQTPQGGQTARANMAVNTVAAAGPFKVTSPALNASYNTGSTQTITWDVAGTNGNGINTANVNILLSTDNGATFTTLLANTPNDGTQVVTMPSTPATNCRILIEAVGNIYYAVSPNFSIGYTITTSCNTYTMNTTFTIPDNNSSFTVRSLNVPTTNAITDVNVGVNINHNYIGDLQVIVQGPMTPATSSTLLNLQCSVNDNINATFDDQGSALVCVSPILGNVTPNSPLSVFNGLNPNGNWLIGVRDLDAGVIGTVISYTITICSQVVTLTSDTFGLENFSLYPNPNNGNFNIQFTSNTGNEIKVNVHDIRGREIFNKSYNNNGLFNETLQLDNVQSGVYLVTVQDGTRKEVKKIVIQ